jgi:hypothetical protein
MQKSETQSAETQETKEQVLVNELQTIIKALEIAVELGFYIDPKLASATMRGAARDLTQALISFIKKDLEEAERKLYDSTPKIQEDGKSTI